MPDRKAKPKPLNAALIWVAAGPLAAHALHLDPAARASLDDPQPVRVQVIRRSADNPDGQSQSQSQSQGQSQSQTQSQGQSQSQSQSSQTQVQTQVGEDGKRRVEIRVEKKGDAPETVTVREFRIDGDGKSPIQIRETTPPGRPPAPPAPPAPPGAILRPTRPGRPPAPPGLIGLARPEPLGAVVAPVDPTLSEQLDLDGKGVVIVNVRPGSPADRAGLKPNDIVVEALGKAVANPSNLASIVREGLEQLPKNDPPAEGEGEGAEKREPRFLIGQVKVIRKAKPETLEIRIPATPATIRIFRGQPLPGGEGVAVFEAEGAEVDLPPVMLGVAVRVPEPELREKLELGDVGLGVVEVLPDSAAAKAGIKVDDIIVEVAGKPVETPEKLREAVFSAGREAIAIRILREGEPLELKVGPLPPVEGIVRREGIGDRVIVEMLDSEIPAEARERVREALRNLDIKLEATRPDIAPEAVKEMAKDIESRIRGDLDQIRDQGARLKEMEARIREDLAKLRERVGPEAERARDLRAKAAEAARDQARKARQSAIDAMQAALEANKDAPEEVRAALKKAIAEAREQADAAARELLRSLPPPVAEPPGPDPRVAKLEAEVKALQETIRELKARLAEKSKPE